MPTPRTRKSLMTLRVYRLAESGRRTELTSATVRLGEPYEHPITTIWPDCACARCVPTG